MTDIERLIETARVEGATELDLSQHSLRVLNLSYNELTALPGSFGHLTALEHLFLTGNPVTAVRTGAGTLKLITWGPRPR